MQLKSKTRVSDMTHGSLNLWDKLSIDTYPDTNNQKYTPPRNKIQQNFVSIL